MLIWGFSFVLPVAAVTYGFWLCCYLVNRHNRVWLNGVFAASTAACVGTYLLLNLPLDLTLKIMAARYPSEHALLGYFGLAYGQNPAYNVLVAMAWWTLGAGVLGAGITRLAQHRPFHF